MAQGGAGGLTSALGRMPGWLHGGVVGLALLGILYGGLQTGEWLRAAGAGLSFALLLYPIALLLWPASRAALPPPGRLSPFHSLWLVLVYALYSLTTGGGSLAGGLILTGYLLASALLVIPVSSPASPLVLMAALVMWIPFDVNWGGERPMAAIWGWPAGVGYPMSALVAVGAALIYFAWARPLRLRIGQLPGRRGIFLVGGLFVLLSILLIPLGMAIRFLAPGLSDEFGLGPAGLVLSMVGVALAIALFTALPEELLFRGILQGWLEEVMGRERWGLALIAAAVIFGAAHLNNRAGIYAPPNFAYMGLATLAGLAYGLAWRRAGLWASVLLHTLVDWTWHFFLHGRVG